MPAGGENAGAGSGTAGESRVAMLEPSRPATPRDEAAERWAKATAFARGFAGVSCFAVMPSAGAGGVPGFQAFGMSIQAKRRFAEAAAGLSEKPSVAFADLSPSQCGALDFFRTAVGASDFSLAMRLDSGRVADHSEISGRISRPDGGPVWLMLIDDDGLVQTVGRVEPGEGDVVFRIPVNLTNGTVATEQLLMAISGEAMPPGWREAPSRQASAFFSILGRAMEENGTDVDVALQAFGVDPAGAGAGIED